MEPFIFLEHTADAKFQAFGKSLEEAFSNALKAMFYIIHEDLKDIKKCKKKAISLKAATREALLYDFLSEALFYLDTEHLILPFTDEITINKINNQYELKAVLTGDKVSHYKTHGDIKAVTYNEMQIKKNQRWMVQVVVDI